MEIKREVSILIPYTIKNTEVFVYLQKRGKEATVLPGHFSFFGGKIEEGESPAEALEREIKEELGFDVKHYNFLGQYQSFKDKTVILNAYFANVSDNFEKEVTVMEGDYGKFFSEQEVLKEPMLIDSDKNILKDLYILLNKKSA
jgi:mutator protein MutT